MARPYASAAAAPPGQQIGPARYAIHIRDLMLDWPIGVFHHEHDAPQPIIINIDLESDAPGAWQADDYQQVVCYADLVQAIIALKAAGHIKLVETLAHRIASLALQDSRIISAHVRIDKPEAIDAARMVGVSLTLHRTSIAQGG